jgi:hypothetical protein
MCNLYSLNKGQDHIGREFRVNWVVTETCRRCPASSQT